MKLYHNISNLPIFFNLFLASLTAIVNILVFPSPGLCDVRFFPDFVGFDYMMSMFLLAAIMITVFWAADSLRKYVESASGKDDEQKNAEPGDNEFEETENKD